MDDSELRNEMLATEHRVRELGFEIEFLKGMRPVRKLLRKPSRVIKALGRWKKSGVEIKALGQKNERSTGTEVALLGARSEVVYAGLPWYVLDPDPNWVLRKEPKGCYGHALITDDTGTIRLVLRGHEPKLLLRRGPNAGKVEITRRGHSKVVDLYSREPDVLELSPKRDDGLDEDAAFQTQWASVEADQTLESLQATDNPVLAVTVDGWLGVGSATRTLFERTLVLTHRLTASQVDHWARRIHEAGARHVVLSGVCSSHLQLAQRLREIDDGVRVDALWHGSYVQAREDFAWDVFQQMVRAAREGHLNRIGVVKRGMERWFQKLGISSDLLLNYVPKLPAAASKPDEGGPHVGVWLSNENYRKLPFAMLAAVGMIDGAVLRGAGLSERSLEYVSFLEIPQERLTTSPLPGEDLRAQMARCHVNLYVTASECCPMLPLESLAEGTPCLVSPNSHLFEDDEFLHSRLVVPRPTRPIPSPTLRNAPSRNATRSLTPTVAMAPATSSALATASSGSWLAEMTSSTPEDAAVSHETGSLSPATTTRRICLVSYEIHPTTWGGCGMLLHHSAELLVEAGHEVVFLLDIPRKYFEKFRDQDRLGFPHADRISAYHVDELCEDFEWESGEAESPFVWKARRFDHALRGMVAKERIDFVEFFEYCGVGYYALARKLYGLGFVDNTLGIRVHNSIEWIDVHEATKPLTLDRYLLYGLGARRPRPGRVGARADADLRGRLLPRRVQPGPGQDRGFPVTASAVPAGGPQRSLHPERDHVFRPRVPVQGCGQAAAGRGVAARAKPGLRCALRLHRSGHHPDASGREPHRLSQAPDPAVAAGPLRVHRPAHSRGDRRALLPVSVRRVPERVRELLLRPCTRCITRASRSS